MKPQNSIKLNTSKLVLIALVFMGIQKVAAHVSNQERKALVDLYNHTQGSSWTQTWDLSAPVSTWYGVTVVNDKVVAIDLVNNGLSGTLPASIGALSKLKTLNLHKNNLQGAIPASIGELTALKSLNLSLNQMEGLLPTALKSLSNLVYLDIYFNDFTGDLKEITHTMSKLTRCTSFGNDLHQTTPALTYTAP
jgi:hypothetical protein